MDQPNQNDGFMYAVNEVLKKKYLFVEPGQFKAYHLVSWENSEEQTLVNIIDNECGEEVIKKIE